MLRVYSPDGLARHLARLGCSPAQIERHVAPLRKKKQPRIKPEDDGIRHQRHRVMTKISPKRSAPLPDAFDDTDRYDIAENTRDPAPWPPTEALEALENAIRTPYPDKA